MEKIFTQEDIIKIIDMYKKGNDIEIIMNDFNSDEHCIRIILKEYQIDRKYNTFSEELLNRVIFQHKQGFLHKEISYNLLVSGTGINKIIDRANIPRMSYSDRNRRFDRDKYYFDKIDTPNKAYILGILYADGNNYTQHNVITLQLQKEDVFVLERIKEELKYEGKIRENNISKRNPKHKDARVLCINDEYISNQLEKLGMVNSKSLILKFPTWLDKSLYSHFIRGYFDGDGCISQTNGKYTTRTCGTKELINQFSDILNDLNINHSIFHPKQCGNSNTYILQTNGNKSTYQFMSWLYQDADIKIDRKYHKYLDLCNKYKNCINLI